MNITNEYKNIVLAIYLLTICLVISFFIKMINEHYFVVNIKKIGESYKIKENYMVVNDYKFIIQNNENKVQEYIIETVDNENFEIEDFNTFKLNPREKIEKNIKIQTKKRLFLSDFKDLQLNIRVKVSLKDTVKKEIIKGVLFIYPKNSLAK